MSNTAFESRYIGGYYSSTDEDEFIADHPIHQSRELFPDQLGDFKRTFFETGTDAIAAILAEISASKSGNILLWLPEHYCQSTVERIRLKQPNVGIKNYASVDETHGEQKNNVILLSHFSYFSSDLHETAVRLNQGSELVAVIEDYVHAPIEIRKSCGHYAFNSLRKLIKCQLSVAYLKQSIAQLPGGEFTDSINSAMALKTKYQIGEGSITESDFIQATARAESLLNRAETHTASESEVARLEYYRLGEIMARRRKNKAILDSRLAGSEEIEAVNSDYLFWMGNFKKRDQLRNFLFSNRIAAPIHWLDANTGLSKTIMSLPIDHRYTEIDMHRMADCILQFYSQS